MKQRFFTFLLIAGAGLTACKKNGTQPDIKEYDQTQIQNYISANGLTGFSEDTTRDGNGTTGLHYKIIIKGSGDTLKYSDRVSVVYTVKSFDGKFVSSDTITNHFEEYLGHFATNSLPKGLELGIHNLLKYKDASMRLLIPSRLAFGVNGTGSGSASNANSRIAGNQCLDYYVHVIGDHAAYDDMVIKNYLAAKSLTGYTKTASGLYYKILTAGTGAVGSIKEFTTVTSAYTGTLLNDGQFDKSDSSATKPVILVDGVREVLINHAAEGTSLSFFLPSKLAYDNASQGSIPVSSCLRFEWKVNKVTQP